MNVSDIIALAHAGYNVQQIHAIASMMNQQPAQQPVVQQPAQPQQMQQPAHTVVSSPAFPYGVMMQPQQMQQPAQQMQHMQQPAQQPAAPDPVLEQLKILTGAVQQGNIYGTQQPAARTDADIIAAIINPEPKKEV